MTLPPHARPSPAPCASRRAAAEGDPRYRLLADQCTEVVLQVGADGVLTYASPSAAVVLGHDPDALVGTPAAALVHPGDRAAVEQAARAALAAGATTWSHRIRARHADGRWVWTEAAGRAVLDGSSGELVEVRTALRDISDLVRVEEALRASETRFREVVHAVPLAVVVLRLDGRVVLANSAMERLTGYASRELTRLSLAHVVHPEDRVLDAMESARCLAGESDGFELEIRLVTQGGTDVWCRLSATLVRDAQGEARHWLHVYADVSAHRRALELMRHRADHDALTGLPNRRAVVDALEGLLGEPGGQGGVRVALLFCDLDGFKAANDSLGHQVGDDVLRAVSRRFASAVDGAGVLGRFGGDEFVVVLPGQDATGALEVADRIHAALRPPVTARGHRVYLSSSIGIAAGEPASDGEELIRDADTAMYAAKRRGRGRCEVFDSSLRSTAVRRFTTERALRDALSGEGFRLHYQPVVSMATGEVVGHEALLRLEHPERGLMMPADLLEVAEESDLVVPVGRWVLATAVRRAAQRWARGERTWTAVNVSPRELGEGQVVETLRRLLTAHQLPASAVVVEVTEHGILDDSSRREELEALDDLGVELALDDFGTGYSSLTNLLVVPVSTMKLDLAFVAGVTQGRGPATIVRSVVDLARGLGLRVVAEGVEQPEQASALAALGVDLAQGWLYGRPVAELETC